MKIKRDYVGTSMKKYVCKEIQVELHIKVSSECAMLYFFSVLFHFEKLATGKADTLGNVTPSELTWIIHIDCLKTIWFKKAYDLMFRQLFHG